MASLPTDEFGGQMEPDTISSRTAQHKDTGVVEKSSDVPAASVDLVEAVVLLRSPTDGHALTPTQSRAMAESVLVKASVASGTDPESSTIFGNIHSFSLRASRNFLAAIAQNEDVERVLPNAIEGSGVIEPIKMSEIRLPDDSTTE